MIKRAEMTQRAHSHAPDVELTEELIGFRMGGMEDLPRTVFLLRHLDVMEVAAIGAKLGIASDNSAYSTHDHL
jgi:hypothetical protein